VDEIAVQIETPFGMEATDLPLENFCNLIVKNTGLIMGNDSLSWIKESADQQSAAAGNKHNG
jgi:predicted membrane chloride channel (bestrophin family)